MLEEIKNTLKKEPISIIESTHQYYYNKTEKFTSVSKILSFLEKPFDEIEQSYKCSINPKHKLFGVSPVKIIQIWQDYNQLRKDIGHIAHTYNEGVLLKDKTLIGRAKNSKFYDTLYSNGFDDFNLKVLQANKIDLVGCEVMMCYPKFKLAGTTDYLGLWQNYLIVSDWKTNEDFKDYSDYYLVEPFQFLDKSDLTKYTIQTYIYKFMLEENYGLNIKDVRIVWFGKEKQFTYKHTSGLNWYSFAPKFKHDKALIQDIIQFGLEKC